MNASDIIKAKQCATLYKAYYQPTVFFTSSNNTLAVSTFYTGTIFTSTVFSTLYPISSIEGEDASFASCSNTVYTYTCEKPVISYELANNIQCGKYVCGGKVPSVTAWKADTAMGAITTFASDNGLPPDITILSSSNNLYAVRPLICPDPIFVQGTNFQSKCDVCNNFGAGAGACCHACASGQ